MGPPAVNVRDFLTRRPQTKRALAERMGIPAREVEALVQSERLAGAPILSDSDGYWLAAESDEVAQQAARLRSRYITQALTARALRRTAERMKQQEDAERRPAGTLGL